MDFNDMVDKGKKAVQDTSKQIDDARKSPKAGETRESIVAGFDKFMRMLLPGSHKKRTEDIANRMVEPGDNKPPKQLRH